MTTCGGGVMKNLNSESTVSESESDTDVKQKKPKNFRNSDMVLESIQLKTWVDKLMNEEISEKWDTM